MRILYVSQYYSPEMGAPSVRVQQLSRAWAASGHDVTVLTAFPNHPSGTIYPGYRHRFLRLVDTRHQDGVRVLRVAHVPTANRAGWERMVSYSSFATTASLAASVVRDVDIVIATSPQLLVGLVGWLRTKLSKAAFVLEVRDIWPESITASGVSHKHSSLFKILRTLARFLYGEADHVVTVTDSMRGYLIKHNHLTPARVDVIGGGVNLNLFTNTNDRTVAQQEWGLCEQFVVSYVGTLGAAHDLRTVLGAADELREAAPDVVFVLAGEGAAKLSLKREAKIKQLANIRFIDRQDIARVPSLIAASDVCLAVLRNDPLFETVVPTKIFEYMACGKPVLSNIQGETKKLLDLSGAGISVSSSDSRELARGILELRDDKNKSARLGEAGRSYVVANRSWEKLAGEYMAILEKIMKEASFRNKSWYE